MTSHAFERITIKFHAQSISILKYNLPVYVEVSGINILQSTYTFNVPILILNFLTICRFGCISFMEYCSSYCSLDQRRRFVFQLDVGPLKHCREMLLFTRTLSCLVFCRSFNLVSSYHILYFRCASILCYVVPTSLPCYKVVFYEKCKVYIMKNDIP